MDDTHSFYERNADKYAQATLGASLEHHAPCFMSELSTNALVLDLGCGAGRDLRMLSSHGLSAVGLDYSANLAQRARSYSDCPVVVADMRDPPFLPASFEGIWAVASILHLPRPEVLPTLKKCRELLKDNGAFYSSVKVGSGEGPDLAGRWFTYFSPDEWRALLSEAGFDPIEVVISREVRPKNVGEPEIVVWCSVQARAVGDWTQHALRRNVA